MRAPWASRLAAPLLILALCGDARPAGPPARRVDLHGDPLPANVLARLGTLRFRQPGHMALGLAFTPDGRAIVSAGERGGVRVWDARTGRLVRTIPIDFSPRGFALSRDGKRVALGGLHRPPGLRPKGLLRVFDVADGQVVRTWSRDKMRRDGQKLAFSPDGKMLASLDDDGQFRLEEVATGAERLSHQFPRDYAGELAFSPDGKVLAVASGPNARKVYLWRWQDGAEPRELKVSPRGATTLDFSPDGKALVTGDDHDGSVRLWDVKASKRLLTLTSALGYPGVVRYSPDGKYVVGSGSSYKGLILWDAKTGREVKRLPARMGHAHLAAFSPDSRRVACFDETTIRVFDVASGQEAPASAFGHGHPLNFVKLTGDTAYTASRDGTVRIWDARTGRQSRRFDVATVWVVGAAVSPDRRWLAASVIGKHSAVILYNLSSGRRVYRLAGHGPAGGRRSLAFTPDSKRLASWGEDQYLRLWNVNNGKAIEEHAIRPDGKGGPVEDINYFNIHRLFDSGKGVLSTDARRLAVPAPEGLFVFDTLTGKQLAKLKHEHGAVETLALSPDGKSLLCSAWGETRLVVVNGKQQVVRGESAVTLYDTATAGVRKRITLTGRIFGPVAWRPDGKRFAVADPRPSARLFTAAGEPAGAIDLPARATALAFSSDGKRLIVGLDDATAVILNAPAN